jgi:hypothetical protein
MSRAVRLATLAIIGLVILPSMALSAMGQRSVLHEAWLLARHSAGWTTPTGHDSWLPIRRALDHLDSEDPARLYEVTYFNSSDQFIYSPLSIVLYRWTSVGSYLDWRAESSLHRVGRVALGVTAAVTALIMFVCPGPPFRRPSIDRGGPSGGLRHRRAELMGVIVLGGIATLTFYPAVKAYILGNIQVLLNGMIVAALALVVLDRPMKAGVLLGLVSVVKPQVALFLVWALIRREWAFATGMLAAVLTLGVTSLVTFGWPIHREYVALMGVLSSRGESYYASQCFNALMNRSLFLGNNLEWDGGHTQLPYHRGVHIATMTTTLLLLVPALFYRRGRARDRDPLDFCTALLTFTIAAPVAYEHHFGYLVPVFWLVLVRILDDDMRRERTRLLLLGLAFFLCANYFDPAKLLASTAFNVLQSYLFFGALVLLGLMYRLRASARPEPVVAQAHAS